MSRKERAFKSFLDSFD
jgi:hypothetical protein